MNNNVTVICLLLISIAIISFIIYSDELFNIEFGGWHMENTGGTDKTDKANNTDNTNNTDNINKIENMSDVAKSGGGNNANAVSIMSNIEYNPSMTYPLVQRQLNPSIFHNHQLTDAVREYDMRKAFDIFEQPTQRVSRYELPPYYFRRNIDLSTHGYPDTFSQFGILVREGKLKDDRNAIIRLFGRQEYPGSNRYEYYVLISSGNDSIKLPINNRKNELYDDDVVYIKELKHHYRVNLYNYDVPKYYPDILF